MADFCAFQGFPDTAPFDEEAIWTGGCAFDGEEEEGSDIVDGGKEEEARKKGWDRRRHVVWGVPARL